MIARRHPARRLPQYGAMVMAVALIGACANNASSGSAAMPSLATKLGASPASIPARLTTPFLPARPSAGPPQAVCTSATREFIPSQLQLDRLALKAPVYADGLDSQGVFPVPQRDKQRVMAWYRDSALAASSSGSVVLTAHSWTTGDSVGSRLLAARPGDVIRLTGRDGATTGVTACYRLVESRQVDLADYAAVMREQQLTMPTEGPPKLVVLLCDKYNPATQQWEKRRMIFAVPMG